MTVTARQMDQEHHMSVVSITCQYKAAVCNRLVLRAPYHVELVKYTDVKVVHNTHHTGPSIALPTTAQHYIRLILIHCSTPVGQ